MRILHVINSMETGGAEKLLLDTLPHYSSYGVSVDICLLNGKEYPFLKELKRTFVGDIYVSNVKSLYSPKQLIPLWKYVRIKRYDIIHVHLFPSLYWSALLKVFMGKNIKMVFTEHSTSNRRLQNFWFRQVDKICYKAYSKIIAITPEVKTVLKEKLRLSDDKIKIIHNGIDTKIYSSASPSDKKDFFKSQYKFIIQVSRFHQQKDQETLIRAMVLLPTVYVLLLVGDGETRVRCEKLSLELGLKDRVKFLGMRTDIPNLLKMSDIVVQSSHSEGFGLSAVEGMAAGKAVIVSDIKGLGGVVRGAGLLFEKENPHDLKNKILSLEDNTAYINVANCCLNRAADFDIKKMITKYITLYEEICKDN